LQLPIDRQAVDFDLLRQLFVLTGQLRQLL